MAGDEVGVEMGQEHEANPQVPFGRIDTAATSRRGRR
jgi:hypothetical protein